jgi:hypothetical protein
MLVTIYGNGEGGDKAPAEKLYSPAECTGQKEAKIGRPNPQHIRIYIASSGFGYKSFELPDGVLIAFIASTTVNVVGLFVLVAKWMYPAGTKWIPQRHWASPPVT